MQVVPDYVVSDPVTRPPRYIQHLPNELTDARQHVQMTPSSPVASKSIQ
jgi:hypothetical protein